ncbi:tetratricopeptide repeat protein [Oleiagrimonas sp.]|jgi:predicted negative regulator of RcsB-dependent stress response|uniref:YfgM family protein n=1 Tax=Oleiagrimonas sp. TaxID=2010330 RepID=UPI002605B145|nr:tetratricopeptide repeat protein [Oleiagrimonas sp.]MDA3914440.1 tetratricopeptide repeat protein [Oleiagrimonas sp.]
MAFDAYDDYEQSERLQQWLRENGISIVVGIVLGLVLIFGYRQWRAHQVKSRADAAAQFNALTNAYASGKASQADGMVEVLLKAHPDSAYAVFAASERAADDAQNGKLEAAESSLKWAQAHADGEHGALKSLVSMRLARVELARGESKQALAVLSAIPAGDYDALRGELRGDVLVKLGRNAEARKAYQAALDAFGKDAPQYNSVRMKLENLAPARKQGA